MLAVLNVPINTDDHANSETQIEFYEFISKSWIGPRLWNNATRSNKERLIRCYEITEITSTIITTSKTQSEELFQKPTQKNAASTIVALNHLF